MNKQPHLFRTAVGLFTLMLWPYVSFAATYTWSGASGADLFWPTPGNWSPAGPPGANDDANFSDVGTTNGLGLVTSVATANRTLHALRLGQTNGIHNLVINPGVTVTVTGTNHNGYGPLGIDPAATSTTNGLSTFFSGPWPGPGGTTAVMLTNTISGAGTLVVNNPNNELIVRYCNGQNVVHYAALDMSQLSTFVANLGRIGVGYGQPGNTVRAMGRLLLAQTNTITLSGTNFADTVQLIVGDNSGNNDGNSTTAFIHLGQTNRLNVDKVLIGGEKTPGQILFNAGLVSPSLFMRGSDGVGRVASLRVGDESDTGATGSPTTGTLNLLQGTSDLLVDTLILGKSQNGNNTANATGNLSIGAGTLNVNTLEMAAQANSGFGGTVTATANFSNTAVTVNTLLRLGHSAGSAGAMVANLNISGGSMTVNGSYKNDAGVTINVTNATLTMPSGSAIAAKTIQLDGGTLVNAGILKVTNALNVYNNGIIGGSPILDLGNSSLSTALWDVQSISGGSLTVNNALQGKGTIFGNVIQGTGATISPGGISLAGTLSINGTSGNLNLNPNGTLNFDLSNSGSGINDQINASGTVSVNGTNNVFLKSLSGSLDTTTPYTLITASTLVGNQTQFKVVGPLTSGRYTFSFDTTTVPNAVQLVVGGTGPANQTWVGDGSANVWNAQGAANWNNGSGASQFFNLDNVTFDNNGSDTPAINLIGALVPGAMTVSNSTKNYAFKGSGSLSVAGALSKLGTGSLTFSNSSDNTFSSVVTISNGPVTFSNTGQNTFFSGVNLFGGSLTLAGNSTNVIIDPNTGAPVITVGTGTLLSVANAAGNIFNGTQLQLDGVLFFNQPVDAIFDALLLNSGGLTKAGPSKLTLSANNSLYSGAVAITGGTLIAGANFALGNGSILVTDGGALDINGKNLGSLPITIYGAGPTGAGALVNNSGPQNTSLTALNTALHNVNLATNASIGGSGPWHTDPIQNLGFFVITDNLGSSANSLVLTKVGGNQVSLNNAIVDPALGHIDVQQGMLNLQGSTSSLGNPGSNIIVRAGATLSFYDTTTPWDKKFILFGDGATPNIWNYDGTHTIVGTVMLNGNCVFGGAPLGRGIPVSITFSRPVIGPGALIKSDVQNTLILAATNDYAGVTTVSNGTLQVDGISGTNAVTVAGGALSGVGLIRGAVNVQSGGTLSPGDFSGAFATLSISNSLSLGGTNTMDVSKAGTLFTTDLITNVTTLTYGGTLQLNLTGDALAAGDSFQLYNFNSAGGAFTTISPDSPGSGLKWDTSHLTTDGTLRVGTINTSPPTMTVTFSGNHLTLSWPADHTGWVLQGQTNSASVGLDTNWANVPGSASVNSVTFTIDPGNGAAFYRLILP